MEIKTVEKKEDWNKFIIENQGSFLQSFEWGEVQGQSSLAVKRLKISKGGRDVLRVQIIKEKTALFPYFYIPYGPVFSISTSPEEKKEALNLFLEEVKRMAEKEKAVFLKIEPFVALPETDRFQLVFSKKRIQPRKTMILDISRTEEEMLKNMDIRTRYNIRLAIKKGLIFMVSDKYLPIFYDLLKKTRSRQGFVSHLESHYKRIFAAASSDFKVKMFLAEYRKKVIVASIVIFFGKRATSLHMGSDYEHRSLKGAEFNHWHSFLFGKQLGCKDYDFWGIDEKKFPGVTSFKRGFRGQEIEHPPALDFILDQNLYRSYNFLSKLKHVFSRS